MTLDNQSAYIQVGKRVPRIAGTAITAATQVNSIVLENVGLILGVTPRISLDGKVVMELDAEKSKLGAEADGIPVSVSGGTTIRSPSIDVTTAQTTVSANSGETIVLGGLITKSEEKTHRRIPWLGDLPYVGDLFGYKSNNRERTELLIIMTPHVIRDEKDADRAKQIEAARIHWCLADVQEMHGDIGVEMTVGELPHSGPVIFPDRNPRGILPDALQPVPTGPALSPPPDNPEPLPPPAKPAGPSAGIPAPTVRPPGPEGPPMNPGPPSGVYPAGGWTQQYPRPAEPVYHAGGTPADYPGTNVYR